MINFSHVGKVDWWFVISNKLISRQLSSISGDDFWVTFRCCKNWVHRLELSSGHLEVSCTCKERKSVSRVPYRTLNTPWLSKEWSSISVDCQVNSQVVAWKRLTLKNVLTCSAQLSQECQGSLFTTSTNINTLFDAWVACDWPAYMWHKPKSWWFITFQNTFVGRGHCRVRYCRLFLCHIFLSPYLLALMLAQWLFEER